ncbi:WD40 repeat domain-containing protein [Deinococcus taeanensis]|uniref:WD40 repeat domain-containing protein n=1 Tax=Deinococcus taeanensis TaxID=2737050 RepID=UPI001CDC2A65|nr:WD40 repeat domain-containing protein [Deinococcus taeanensis]UBV42586.1 WD40 repeat domain-containing protein [Deinococcus taeanensis]
MRISALLLTAALTAGGAASALTLATPKVYTVPGADSNYAAFLPGGQVAVDADNAVLILDQNLKTQRGWYTLQGPVKALAASPDGTRLAALTQSRWVVWDVATGREVRSGKPRYDATLAFSADGALLMLDDGTLKRTDLNSGQVTDVLGDGELYDVRVSRDGTLAILAFEDHVEFVRLGTAAPLAQADISEDWDGLAVTFSPDGQAAVVRTGSETLILRAGQAQATEVEGGEDLSLEGSVVFLNAGQFVYAEDGEAQLFDAQSGQSVEDAFELDSYETLAAGPDDQVLSLGRSVGRLTLGQLSAPARPRVTLPSANAWTGAFIGGVPHAGVGEFLNLKTGRALNVGNRENLYAAEGQSESIWTLNSGVTVNVYRAGKVMKVATLDEKGEYETLHASPDGRYAAVSGYHGLALLDGQSGKVLKKFTPEQLKVEDFHDAIPTPDGKALIVIPHEGALLRVDVASGRQSVAFKLPADADASELQVSRGGTLAVAYSTEDDDDRLALVKPGATTAFKTLTFTGEVRGVRFSPDGKLLAVLTTDAQNALQVFDTATGALLARTGQFSLRTSLLAWAPGGTQLMVGAGLLGQPGSVTVYDVKR